MGALFPQVQSCTQMLDGVRGRRTKGGVACITVPKRNGDQNFIVARGDLHESVDLPMEVVEHAKCSECWRKDIGDPDL